MAISGGSPQLKGSFLHKAASAEKAVENASPKRVRISYAFGIELMQFGRKMASSIFYLLFVRFYDHRNLDVPGIHQLVRMSGESYRCPSMMTMMTRLVYCMGGVGWVVVGGI